MIFTASKRIQNHVYPIVGAMESCVDLWTYYVIAQPGMRADECDYVLLEHNLVLITVEMVLCPRFMFKEGSFL